LTIIEAPTTIIGETKLSQSATIYLEDTHAASVMRLLDTTTFMVESFGDDEVPPYAILSRTWDAKEVTFQDLHGSQQLTGKKEYAKLQNWRMTSKAHGFNYAWMDTCCIDKTSSAELSEAINSMYRWYQDADVCYAYLADVPSQKAFVESRWFTRG
jgi:hypothetical protein